MKVDLVFRVKENIYLNQWNLLDNLNQNHYNNLKLKEFNINLKLKHYHLVEKKNIENLHKLLITFLLFQKDH